MTRVPDTDSAAHVSGTPTDLARSVVELAPAKVNLYLHVGGVRADGLHALASVFVFADVGDVLTVTPAADLSLRVTGPFAPALAGGPVADNLVLRAARELRAAAGVRSGAHIVLDKQLPVAAGIGGGSADAAATLRALSRLWRIDIGADRLARLAFGLGADVPACLDGRPVHVAGAGENLAAGPVLPPVWICLVNPGVATPTGPIFRAFDRAHPHPAAPAFHRPAARTIGALRDLMAASRNDLQAPAIAAVPVIAEVLASVSACPGAIEARMSGSGATVFALFASRAAAQRAARVAAARGWWSAAARIEGGAGHTYTY